MLHRALVRRGCLFQSTTDSEVFVHLIAISLYSTVVDRLIDALKQVIGAYSLVALSNEALMGVRDPLGVRPLILGRIGSEGTGGWVLASETCALDIVGADFIRDVEPGEIVVINDQGVHSIKPFNKQKERFCVFEYIYFARPDSVMEGMPVYEARKRIGAELAREADVPADVIVPVPDSGVPAAMGYSKQSGIPFELGIIRNHYVGRTFIEPTDHIRHLGVKLKHSANRPVLAGKRVILVDDSIVRGTTSKKIVEMVRAAGAKEGCTCGFPRRRRRIRASTASTRRSAAASCSLPATARRGDGGTDRRRQPGVHLHRRALPSAWQGRARSEASVLLRCLLHRRLSHLAAGPAGQRRTPTKPAGCPPLMHLLRETTVDN